MNSELALLKLKKYCAYQERNHQEVVSKLYDLGLYKNQVEEVLLELIQEDFLNEERYAKAFVSGKFRIKKWGRVKIKSQLKFKKISDYCIRKGMEEIEEEEYISTLKYWIERKIREVSAENKFKKKQKIASFLTQKGFESYLIWKFLNQEAELKD